MKDSLYHVGDEVRVVPDLTSVAGKYMHEGTEFSLCVIDDMVKHAGKPAIITAVEYYDEIYIYYNINISGCAWTADMLIPRDSPSDITLDFSLLGGV